MASKSDLEIIKSPHSKSSYTQEQLEELIQCIDDPLFFMRNFMKVQHPTKGAIPFKPYEYQVRIISAFKANRNTIAMCGRQLGKTTCSAGFILWKTMFTPDTTVLICANKFLQALEIVDRIRFAYENLPNHIRAGVTEYNKGSISFDNGSRIVSRATSGDAGRGLSITLLYLDEFAYVPPNKAQEFWTSIQPTLSCVSGDTLVLTGNGFERIDTLHANRAVGDYFELPIRTFGKHGMEAVSHGYVSPESETLIFETKRGMRLEVTKHHPLYALRGTAAGMIKAEELNPGDQLRVQFGMNVFGSDHKLSRTSVTQITPELGYLVGGLIAEGWLTRTFNKNGVQRNMVSVSNIDPQFRDKFLKTTLIRPFRSVRSNASRLSINSREWVQLLMEVGFDPAWKCDTKEVPCRILTSGREIQAKFLSGLFDGDGCASGDVINLTSTSRKLLNQVQLMLLNFGIVSTVRLMVSAERALAKRHILPQGKQQKTARDTYGLTISGSQRQKFATEIGFHIQRKKDKLAELMTDNQGKMFALPKTAEIVSFLRTVVSETGKTKKWFREQGIRLEKALVEHSTKGVLTTEFLGRMHDVIKTNGLFLSDQNAAIFGELLGEFVWDPIVTITRGHARTYDFTVPGTHSFLQNGILGSNTGGSCIVTSTPKSDEDQFAQIWKSAIDNTDEYGNALDHGRGKNGFFAISVPWWEHPDRDEEWAKPFRESLGEARFRQEFENCFITDDETLVNPLTLARLSGAEPEFYTGTVRWYEPIKANKSYLVALDPSLGTGGDYAAIQVFQLPEMIQVGEWQHNRTVTKAQVGVLMKVLYFLDETLRNDPDQLGDPEIFWTVENNSIGEAILNVIEDTGEERFPGLFVSEKKRKGQTRRFRKGMLTDNRKKLSACARFKSLVESDRCQIKSKQLIKQLKSFVHKEASYAAKPGEHDDLVSAALLCVRMLDVVGGWGADMGDLKEYIGEEELFQEGMPVIL